MTNIEFQTAPTGKRTDLSPSKPQNVANRPSFSSYMRAPADTAKDQAPQSYAPPTVKKPDESTAPMVAPSVIDAVKPADLKQKTDPEQNTDQAYDPSIDTDLPETAPQATISANSTIEAADTAPTPLATVNTASAPETSTDDSKQSSPPAPIKTSETDSLTPHPETPADQHLNFDAKVALPVEERAAANAPLQTAAQPSPVPNRAPVVPQLAVESTIAEQEAPSNLPKSNPEPPSGQGIFQAQPTTATGRLDQSISAPTAENQAKMQPLAPTGPVEVADQNMSREKPQNTDQPINTLTVVQAKRDPAIDQKTDTRGATAEKPHLIAQPVNLAPKPQAITAPAANTIMPQTETPLENALITREAPPSPDLATIQSSQKTSDQSKVDLFNLRNQPNVGKGEMSEPVSRSNNGGLPLQSTLPNGKLPESSFKTIEPTPQTQLPYAATLTTPQPNPNPTTPKDMPQTSTVPMDETGGQPLSIDASLGNAEMMQAQMARLPAAGLSSAIATPAPPPPLAPPLQAIAPQIRESIEQGKPTTLELTLSPEELGKIRLYLSPDGDRLRIVIQAERAETMDLLRRNTEAFSNELRQSGFSASSFSFEGWGDSSQNPGKQKARLGIAAYEPPPPEVASLAKRNTSLEGSVLNLRV